MRVDRNIFFATDLQEQVARVPFSAGLVGPVDGMDDNVR
jgi:hypothetical protein